MKVFVISLLLLTATAFADCPMHEEHSKDHHSGVDARGDQAMGFDHAKTTHHFLIKDNGGFIQVTANDPEDTASVQQIRTHLQHIARMFSKGDFSTPMFIHDRIPPGVTAMKEFKDAISYQYEEVESGGRVVVATKTPEAVAAVREFLRFQIDDHRTGDPK